WAVAPRPSFGAGPSQRPCWKAVCRHLAKKDEIVCPGRREPRVGRRDRSTASLDHRHRKIPAALASNHLRSHPSQEYRSPYGGIQYDDYMIIYPPRCIPFGTSFGIIIAQFL